jgi:hypothetical protein
MNFVAAPMTSNEPRRIEAVKKLGVIGTDQSELFYVYAELALAITGFAGGTTSLIDENTQHHISACGPIEMEDMIRENPQFPRSQSPCAYTILSPNPKLVPDCREHEIFKNAMTVLNGMVVAYAGFPIINKDNYVYGTLCMFHPDVKEVSPDKAELVEKLVKRLAHQLDTQLEQKEATAEKVSEAVSKFSDVISDASLSDFSAFVSLCSGKDLEHSSYERLKKANLCIRTETGGIDFTDGGKKLQYEMGLQTKIINRRRIEGQAAETMMTEMLANLENL